MEPQKIGWFVDVSPFLLGGIFRFHPLVFGGYYQYLRFTPPATVTTGSRTKPEKFHLLLSWGVDPMSRQIGRIGTKLIIYHL